jgi:hypothetical protein
LLLCKLRLELGLHHIHDGLADVALLVADGLEKEMKIVLVENYGSGGVKIWETGCSLKEDSISNSNLKS